MSRRLVALVMAGFLGSGAAGAPASPAESSTVCIGRQDVMQLTPGLSQAPTTGTGVTVVKGTLECNGPLEGYQPTGPVRTRHEFVYGDPATCSGISAKGWNDYFIPTTDGVVVIRNHFTATFRPSTDPPGKSATFDGDHSSGRFWFRPLEGDCLKTPLTRMEVGWIATWQASR